MSGLGRVVGPDAGCDPVSAERAEQGRGNETGGGLGHRDLHLGTLATEVGHHLAGLEGGHTAADPDQDATPVEGQGHAELPPDVDRVAWMIASISRAARFASSFTT